MTQTPKAPPDWERIEADYRAGLLTLREIAEPHGITEAAIRKRAKRDQWERDLGARIQARAEQLVRKQAVREPSTTLTPANERQVVEANARAVADVHVAHRRGLSRTQELVAQLEAELAATCRPEVVEQLRGLVERTLEGDEARKLLARLDDLLELPTRIQSALRLVDAQTKLVTAERKVWGIEDGAEGGAPGSPMRQLSDVERATRLATLLGTLRARAAAQAGQVEGKA